MPQRVSDRRLTVAQLAVEANSPTELVDELVRAGAIRPADDGLLDADDVPRVALPTL